MGGMGISQNPITINQVPKSLQTVLYRSDGFAKIGGNNNDIIDNKKEVREAVKGLTGLIITDSTKAEAMLRSLINIAIRHNPSDIFDTDDTALEVDLSHTKEELEMARVFYTEKIDSSKEDSDAGKSRWLVKRAMAHVAMRDLISGSADLDIVVKEMTPFDYTGTVLRVITDLTDRYKAMYTVVLQEEKAALKKK